MSTSNGERLLPAPQVDAATEFFFSQAREGRLFIKACTSCGKPHWYPRALCPFCMGDTEWRSASGRGTIYSVSVTRRAGPEPYAIAYVTLDEGVTLLTNIVDCDLDQLRIGDRVEVTFKPAEGGAVVPMFRPAQK
jgi:uncharacterized OB-fold protein